MTKDSKASPTPANGARVLVAGLGYVGALAAELVARELGARGGAVFGLVRTARAMPPGVASVIGDVSSPESLTALPSDLDTIVYAVAPDAHDDDAYERAYPGGLSNLLAADQQAGSVRQAPRVILVSSTAVYDQSDGQRVDDSSEAIAPEQKAVHLRAAEQVALGSHPSSLVVRASGIYGPERTSLARRLAAEAPRPEFSHVLSCRIHRLDLARIIVEAVLDPALSGTILASDETPATFREIHDFLKDREVPPPDAAAPSPRRQRAHRSRRFVPQRLLERGFAFRYPSFREGYGELFAARSA